MFNQYWSIIVHSKNIPILYYFPIPVKSVLLTNMEHVIAKLRYKWKMFTFFYHTQDSSRIWNKFICVSFLIDVFLAQNDTTRNYWTLGQSDFTVPPLVLTFVSARESTVCFIQWSDPKS